jgi:hypothetical protein
MLGVEIESPDAEPLAQRWAAIFGADGCRNSAMADAEILRSVNNAGQSESSRAHLDFER